MSASPRRPVRTITFVTGGQLRLTCVSTKRHLSTPWCEQTASKRALKGQVSTASARTHTEPHPGIPAYPISLPPPGQIESPDHVSELGSSGGAALAYAGRLRTTPYVATASAVTAISVDARASGP